MMNVGNEEHSMETRILPNMIPLRNIDEVDVHDRIFYELGYKINVNLPNGPNNWISIGRFKEIKDVHSFLKDDRLRDLEYLEHHNFMYIKATF